jgi:hypothetical protein
LLATSSDPASVLDKIVFENGYRFARIRVRLDSGRRHAGEG